MANVVFHIGFGKTGSSSLQAYLSRTAGDRLGDSSFVYCAIDRDGEVLSGEELSRRAASGAPSS
ncbi:hypothetical protein FJ872_07060 [Mesorhizobium sp. B2-5-9]|uniref:hypothetical protein n=1 Tax=Mesorhizobium sp. B2-5-9 TaxID=2589921 RepID=UPI0011270F8A|nr:hypothetical protein [Mesorhizobium sp. B2-5-9]TPK22360.1 hypothetical protein FJ872_07060 [Mesorhizobium sp. B2-5-9]